MLRVKAPVLFVRGVIGKAVFELLLPAVMTATALMGVTGIFGFIMVGVFGIADDAQHNEHDDVRCHHRKVAFLPVFQKLGKFIHRASILMVRILSLQAGEFNTSPRGFRGESCYTGP